VEQRRGRGASAPVNPGDQGLDGGPGQEEKREAGVERGSPATVASSGGWRR